MLTAATNRSPGMTFEEAAKLDPDEMPGEIEAGRWVPSTRNAWRHGEVSGNVYLLLRLWTRDHPGFRVSVGDPGARLGRDPDLLRGPDVAVVAADRVPQGKGVDGWLEGAPDLAVEVLGDAQPPAAALKKALEYLATGGRLVWIVDPDARQVVVVTPPDHLRVVAEGELDAGDVLPGFRCQLGELFS
jgi:Uma2 family endonuclease